MASISKNLFIAIFVIIGLSKANANTIACGTLFNDQINLNHQYRNIGVSLTYAPALMLDNQVKVYENYVFIETFKTGNKNPSKQLLTPYVHEPSGLPYPYGKELLHNSGLNEFYMGFAMNFEPEILNNVKKAENKLPLNRIATFMNFNPERQEAQGFMRIFDGSIYESGSRKWSKYLTPLEIELSAQSKNTEILNQKRKEGFDVFEIGKYFIKKNLDPKETALIKTDIFHWLTDYLESRGLESLKKSYFFAHVSSLALQRNYKTYFKFDVVDPAYSTGLTDNESILLVRGDVLLQAVSKLTKDINLN